MICPHCRANLLQRNHHQEPIVRCRGIVLRASGPVLICAKCRAEVPFNPAILQGPQVAISLRRHALPP